MPPKTSHYYRSRATPLKVTPSYLFLEFLAQVIEQDSNLPLSNALLSAATHTYNIKELSVEDLEALAQILSEDTKKQAEGEQSTEGATKLGMGTQCIEWLAKLTPQDLCLLLADFDPKQAEELYCNTDYRLVTEMGKVHMESRWHQIQSQYEAAMYAFGGGYKEGGGSSSDSDKGTVTTLDLTKNNSAALGMLKQSGF